MKSLNMGLSGPGVLSLCLATTLLLSAMPAESIVSESTQCCSCKDMMPTDVPRGVRPQTSPSPFKITLQKGVDTYTANQTVKVTLESTGSYSFRSFMLIAVPVDSLNERPLTHVSHGTFAHLGDVDHQDRPSCPRMEKLTNTVAYAVERRTRDPVKKLEFLWTPLDNYGHIQFRATFIHNDTTFWVRVKSRDLYDSSKRIPDGINIPPINTDGCGKTKGCYRVPEGCIEPQCYFILTWKSDGFDNIQFELGGLTEGDRYSYVAAALSDDTYVGDDLVFVCAHTRYRTEIYFGEHNDEYETIILPKYKDVKKDGSMSWRYQSFYTFLLEDQGSFQDKRLRCRFTVNSKMDGSKLKSLRGWKPHLIMSRGLADDGKPNPMGVGYDEFPHASEDPVLFTRNSDNSGRASYPLVKAHGCLMILAWILFSSIGFLLAKYYQPMWPEKRTYDRKYWFAGHFKAMVWVFILVVISIILIFIEADGYTYARDLPYKAHPILGIIIFVCVLLLPFIALLRPGKGHDCRNVFNWLYWIFATIANVLAVPNIFIGMNFGKSAVPWWATWILVFWVIFHIIVEITLEIHMCMTHKKNKDKRKKHELLKRDYPKQHHPVPPPAGRRFKRFMLFLHAFVTILVTLIMVIVIAVS